MRVSMRVRVLFAAISIFLASSTLAQSISEVRAELIQMLQLDQGGREEITRIREQFGNTSPEMDSAWEKQTSIDKRNMSRLEGIIAHFGWPGISTFGQEAATAAFLILQHSDLEQQKKYLPNFRTAVEAGEARSSSYALLYDRVLMGEGKKQLYGSQLRLNEESGGYYLWPIDDDANVDQRRVALDMPPLAEYLKQVPFEIEEVPADIVAKFAAEEN